MLMDLSKDIMMDLGITVIGDIIAILKHAKQVYRQVRGDVEPPDGNVQGMTAALEPGP